MIEKVDNVLKDYFEVVNCHYLKEYVNNKCSRIYDLAKRKLLETSNIYELGITDTYLKIISYSLNGKIVKIKCIDNKKAIEINKDSEKGYFFEVDENEEVIYKYNSTYQVIAVYNLTRHLEELAILNQEEINNGFSLKAKRVDAFSDKVICKMKNDECILMYYGENLKWKKDKNDNTLDAEIFKLPNNKIIFKINNKYDGRCVKLISENAEINGYQLEYIRKNGHNFFYSYDKNANLVTVYNEALSPVAKCKDDDKYIHVFKTYSKHVKYEDERTFQIESSEVEKIIYLVYEKDGKCRKVYENNECILEAKKDTHFESLGDNYILVYEDKHIIKIIEYSYNTHHFFSAFPPVDDTYYTIYNPSTYFWDSLKGDVYILNKYSKNDNTLQACYFIINPSYQRSGVLLQINSEKNIKIFDGSCIVLSDDGREITIVNENLEHNKFTLSSGGKFSRILTLNDKKFITETIDDKIVAIYLVADTEVKQLVYSRNGIEIVNGKIPYIVIDNKKCNLFGNPL